MGSAIAERIKSVYPVSVFDQDKAKTRNLSGIKVTENAIDLVKEANIVILAVKPQDFVAVLDEIKDHAKDKLIISIAAGITTNYLEKILGRAKIIRAMPNFPAKIGKGVICLCKGRFANANELGLAQQLFKALGRPLILNEDMMNAATAISGSGPGYYYEKVERSNIDYNNIPGNFNQRFEEELAEAARGLAFDAGQASILASATTAGSLALLKATRLTPAELKKQITSKKGTTEAGLEVLQKGGSLLEAAKAAAKRAEELARS